MSNTFKNAESLYFHGNYSAAYKMCRDAEREGDVKCQRLLGWMCFRGNGCAKDDGEALRYFTNAAQAGDAEACFGIGAVHYEKQNYRDALVYFEESAAHGFIPAKRWAGVLYQLGLGVGKDLGKAKELYIQAAREGNLSAYLQYSLMRLHGDEGSLGRIKAIPMLAKFLLTSFREGWRDPNSQRLM